MSQTTILSQQYENNNLHMVSTSSRTTSSSTRTTKVIEELQDNLDCIQKEVESTKQQLQIAKDNRDQFEKEIENFLESNKQLRSNINEVLRTLESKQELLDSTKKASLSIENKVKELKDEALMARKESDDLKRKESSLEKELNTMKILKENQIQQQNELKASVIRSQKDFDEELGCLQELLDIIKETIKNVEARDIPNETKSIFANVLSNRTELFTKVKQEQDDLAAVGQQFLDRTREDLDSIRNDDSDIEKEKALLDEVNGCKEEADMLLERIKKNASNLLIKDKD